MHLRGGGSKPLCLALPGQLPGSEADLQGGRHLALCAALDTHLQKITELANPGVLHLQRAVERPGEARGEDAGRAEDAGAYS